MSSVRTFRPNPPSDDALLARIPGRASRCRAARTAAAADTRPPSAPSPSARSPTACSSPACCRRRSVPGLCATGQREERSSPTLVVGGERKVAGCPRRDGPSTSSAGRAPASPCRLALGSAGASSGKKPSTRSSTCQLALGDSEAHRRGREALAQRVQHVRLAGRIRRPPALGDHLPVPHDHDAVEGVELLLGLFDEAKDRGRRDALRLRRAAREGEGWRFT